MNRIYHGQLCLNPNTSIGGPGRTAKGGVEPEADDIFETHAAYCERINDSGH